MGHIAYHKAKMRELPKARADHARDYEWQVAANLLRAVRIPRQARSRSRKTEGRAGSPRLRNMRQGVHAAAQGCRLLQRAMPGRHDILLTDTSATHSFSKGNTCDNRRSFVVRRKITL